uniref:Photosystem I reaction center subunit PsaK n=1 Tax=Bostrychia simpliciuscula TaxID=324754 RepID=A0A1Z1M7U7_9FLOR|nr:photosystem I reaction center subunit X [Bostrychia simpliciuscula]ARW62040.1 photosystem I reaction center subunit X [Bostrychia simpliciuscula]
MQINFNNMLSVISLKSTWSVKIAFVMIICNLICIGIGRYAIKIRGLGPSIPILGLEGLGLPELLATTSLGHIIGSGTIICLKNINFI